MYVLGREGRNTTGSTEMLVQSNISTAPCDGQGKRPLQLPSIPIPFILIHEENVAIHWLKEGRGGDPPSQECDRSSMLEIPYLQGLHHHHCNEATSMISLTRSCKFTSFVCVHVLYLCSIGVRILLCQ